MLRPRAGSAIKAVWQLRKLFVVVVLVAFVASACSPAKQPAPSGSNTKVTPKKTVAPPAKKAPADSRALIAGLTTSPAPKGKKITMAKGQVLKVKGWCVAQKRPNIVLKFNGANCPYQEVKRQDVEKGYPKHPVHIGFEAKVPPKKLKPKNTCELLVDGKKLKSLSFEVVTK